MPPEALEAAPGCVVVSRYGVGVDNIPVERATELGILVVNVPDFCLDEVSDHAMALRAGLRAAHRPVCDARRAPAPGICSASAAGCRGCAASSSASIGFGNIARALVPKAQGFGLDVLAYTPRLAQGRDASGVRTTNDLGRAARPSRTTSRCTRRRRPRRAA